MAEAAKAGAKDGKPIGWVAKRAIAKAGDTVNPVASIEQARGQREALELAERERVVDAKRYDIANDYKLEIIDEATRDERLAAVAAELYQIRAARAQS